jgi:hypothetical protein
VKAKNAARNGQDEAGWKYLLAVQRLELFHKGAEDREAEAIALRREATKLNKWREEAVLELLKPTAVGIERLYRAAALRDEHYNNQAYKDALGRGIALMLALTLGIVLAGLIWEAERGAFDKLQTAWKGNSLGQESIVLIALVGILGANVSAITNQARERVPARIPEMVSTFRVTALRLFIGSAAAIFLLFVVKGGFFLNVTESYGMLAIAFAAGFSERLVTRVVRSIVDGDERSSASGDNSQRSK